MLGCGTIKSWVGWGDNKEDGEKNLIPPPEEEVQKNPDGTWNFTEEQLNPKEINWMKWVFLFGFLGSTGILMARLIMSAPTIGLIRAGN